MKSKAALILEIIWIVIGTVTFLLAIKVLVGGEGKQYLSLFLMSVISFAFAWFRHNQRKKS